ncbi:SmdA family multidrug ABC transporter permease/ATP-binding protein [Candidatus Profftia sp. (ex Adelges kitamiensis)]|uniref:SmdA family multidrug ABC transporter permease/ATP-binding protein n=1 Tax=Candidatus Profftia sp. (ex Adelges kitamiensis) TaxID=2864218 RepID=UPI001CE30CF4|nr:SmdA family multidrug ABC transporter permease/ATP-binding protein [Candidatus Profftia sp. (ex Adelges kitamiensis)]
MRLLNQLRWYFLREWQRYLGSVILLIIISILQVIPPHIVGIVIDGVLNQCMPKKVIIFWISILLAIAVIVYLLRYVGRILLFSASYLLAVDLRKKYYTQLSYQSQDFYQRHHTGDLIARATNDVDYVVFAAGEGILTLIDSLVIGLSVFLIMSTQISWGLTILSLLPMPIMEILIKHQGNQLYTRFKSSQDAFSILYSQTQEILTSICMIKSFGLENHQSNRFKKFAVKASMRNMHVAKIDACFNPIIYITISCSHLLAIGGGSIMLMHDQLTLGQLTSFIMYLGLMIWPMLALAWMFNILERGSASYSRISSILSEQSAIIDGVKTLPEGRGKLSMHVKLFSYRKDSCPVLYNVDFNLSPGQILGICGPTGSGKSTLLSLIQRQFDPSKGEIYFHGISLRKLRLEEWRSRLAVVSQMPFLFSDSISMNIALGKPEATQGDIIRVAKIANIHEDILSLPKGYQTEVGERGIMLSGGQKQRIAIARALLLNSEILLLDDSLSAVDYQTEYNILHNLREWGYDKTLIISAHRLSALTKANEIIVLKEGVVIQRNQHSKLSKQDGWYKDMYHFQQIEARLNEPCS